MTYLLKVVLNLCLLVGIFALGLSLVVPSAYALVLGLLLVVAVAGVMYLVSAPLMVFMMKASPLAQDARFAALHDHVIRDAAQMGLARVPRLFVTDSPVFNAFAAGHPANGAIIFSTGLLKSLGDAELRAVAGHEMAHIKHHDNALGVLNVVTVFAIRVVTWVLFGMIVLAGIALDMALGMMGGTAAGKSTRMGARLGLWLRQISEWLIAIAVAALMGVSRENEFRADAAGAKLVSPVAMAGALITMDRVNGSAPVAGWMDRLYRSHPETEERLTALRKGGA